MAAADGVIQGPPDGGRDLNHWDGNLTATPERLILCREIQIAPQEFALWKVGDVTDLPERSSNLKLALGGQRHILLRKGFFVTLWKVGDVTDLPELEFLRSDLDLSA